MITVVKAKKIYTVTGPVVEHGALYMEEGRIKAVSPGNDVPSDARIIDLSDFTIYPGFIDPASHLGIGKEPLNFRTEDIGSADLSNPLSPELRTEDGIDPFSPALDLVRAEGVTTCYAAPGPGSLIDGQGISFKLRHAETPKDMCIAGSEQMHFSLGDIPVTTFKAKNQAPMTRMAATHMLRKEFDRVLAKPDDGAAPLFRTLCGGMRARFFCLSAQDIWAAMQFADEYKLDYAIDGAFEAWRLPQTLGERRPAFVLTAFPFGPMQNGIRDKYEYRMTTAAKLAELGCPVALTVRDVSNTKMLRYLAGFAIAHGLSPEKALASITIEAARVLGLDGRIGSLESGKDADFAVFDGDALLSTTRCLATYIEGEPVYAAKELSSFI